MKTSRAIFISSFVALQSAALLFACGGVDPSTMPGSDDGGETATDGSRSSNRDSGRSDSGGVLHDGGDGVQSAMAQCGTNGASPLTCSSSQPTCCAFQYNDGLFTTTSFSCTAGESACAGDDGGVPLTCRDNSNCNGGKPNCCGELTAQNTYTSLGCESECPQFDDAGNLTLHVLFCSPDAGADVCAPWGLTCQASTVLPGFSVCGGD